jgi:hypothetical protein
VIAMLLPLYVVALKFIANSSDVPRSTTAVVFRVPKSISANNDTLPLPLLFNDALRLSTVPAEAPNADGFAVYDLTTAVDDGFVESKFADVRVDDVPPVFAADRFMTWKNVVPPVVCCPVITILVMRIIFDAEPVIVKTSVALAAIANSADVALYVLRSPAVR